MSAVELKISELRAEGEALAPARRTSVEVARKISGPLDVSELAGREFKRRAELLGPLIREQDLLMIFGPRGLGKTHAVMAMAFAVATSGRWLKYDAAAPRKVLYLDGELPGRVLQERIAMHAPEVDPAPGLMRFWTPDLLALGDAMPDLGEPAGQTAILGWIESDTALVVIDNLSAWVRSGKENDADAWQSMSDFLLALRRRGHAVLIVHHAGKGGDQRGTSRREDLLDTSIRLARPTDYEAKEGARFDLTFSKARHLFGDDAEGLQVDMKTRPDGTALWGWNPLADATRSQVVELLNGGMTQSEIAAELGLSRGAVSKQVARARRDGQLPAAQGGSQ